MTNHLNPLTIVIMWVICGAAMGWANYRSFTEAWSQASARNERKSWRFFLSFIAREQLAYANACRCFSGFSCSAVWRPT